MKNIKILLIICFLQAQIALTNPIKETVSKTIKLTAQAISTYLTPEEELRQEMKSCITEISQAIQDEIDQEEQEIENFKVIQKIVVDQLEQFMLEFRKNRQLQNTITILKADSTHELHTPDKAYEVITKSFATLLIDSNDSKKFIDHVHDMKIMASHLTPNENEKHKEVIKIINFLDANKDKNNLWNPLHLSFWMHAWKNEETLNKIPLPPTTPNLSQNEIISIISKKL